MKKLHTFVSTSLSSMTIAIYNHETLLTKKHHGSWNPRTTCGFLSVRIFLSNENVTFLFRTQACAKRKLSKLEGVYNKHRN